MKTNLMLFLALSVGMFGKMAVAQGPAEQAQAAQVQYVVFHPAENNAALQLTAWDRDRDRDRDRDGRWRNGNNGYYGNNGYNGYYGNNGYYNNGYYRNNPYYGNTAAGNYRNGQRGEWGRNGDFHPFGSNGFYDRNGNWHNGGGWWR